MRYLLLVLTIIVSSFSSDLFAQKKMSAKKAQQYKKEQMIKLAIEHLLKDSTFCVHITGGGMSAYVTSLGLASHGGAGDNYFIKLDKNRLKINMPYSGARSSSLLGGGIEVDTEKFEYSYFQLKKGKGWAATISCRSTGIDVESLTFAIEITNTANTSIGFTSSGREPATYLGTLRELPK